jgi:hypothetical protein
MQGRLCVYHQCHSTIYGLGSRFHAMCVEIVENRLNAPLRRNLARRATERALTRKRKPIYHYPRTGKPRSHSAIPELRQLLNFPLSCPLLSRVAQKIANPLREIPSCVAARCLRSRKILMLFAEKRLDSQARDFCGSERVFLHECGPRSSAERI